MKWAELLIFAERFMTALVEAVADDGRMPYTQPIPTPPARCAECGSEPWVVRWGTIRVGQQLDGYYYQATTGKEHKLLCRGCWHAAIGVTDPLDPTSR